VTLVEAHVARIRGVQHHRSAAAASDLVEREAEEVRGDPASLSPGVHAQGLEPPRACGGGDLVEAVEAVAVQRDDLRDEGGLRFRGVRAEKRDGARALAGDRDDPLVVRVPEVEALQCREPGVVVVLGDHVPGPGVVAEGSGERIRTGRQFLAAGEAHIDLRVVVHSGVLSVVIPCQ